MAGVHSPRMAEGTMTRVPFPHGKPHSSYGHWFIFLFIAAGRRWGSGTKGHIFREEINWYQFRREAGNGSICSSCFQQPLALGDVPLLTADPGSTHLSHPVHWNLQMGPEKLEVCNAKRTRTSARKKTGGCDLEIRAPAFIAGDNYGNKPSGMSQFSALFMIPRPPWNWGTAASPPLVRQDP